MTEAIAPIVPDVEDKLPDAFLEDAIKPGIDGLGPPSYTEEEERRGQSNSQIGSFPTLTRSPAQDGLGPPPDLVSHELVRLPRQGQHW